MTDRFQLVAPYQPAGDQPQAIERLAQGFESGLAAQTLLGVTGSGKTFTIASVIERVQRYGNVVVVMGRDTVDGPPHGAIVDRRFTNVWQLQDGVWKMIARHAQIVAPRPTA